MKISVTGMGLITPRGDFTLHAPFGPRDSRDGLLDDGSLPDFDLKNYLATPKTYLDRASALALAGCALALRDAGLEGPFDVDFGICLGTQFGCVETMRSFEATLHEKGARGVSPLLFSHSYFNSPISLCAIEWGLKGYHGPFCGEKALQDAVGAAHDAIALGHADKMLCGGFEALSKAREWSGEGNPSEWSAVWVLEKDGEGADFGEVFREGWSLESFIFNLEK